MSEFFGEKLKSLRKERNITQAELAKIFNVSKMTISAWESNKQEPNINNIIKIAILFDISTDELLGIEDESGRKIFNIQNTFNNYSGIIKQIFKK